MAINEGTPSNQSMAKVYSCLLRLGISAVVSLVESQVWDMIWEILASVGCPKKPLFPAGNAWLVPCQLQWGTSPSMRRFYFSETLSHGEPEAECPPRLLYYWIAHKRYIWQTSCGCKFRSHQEESLYGQYSLMNRGHVERNLSTSNGNLSLSTPACSFLVRDLVLTLKLYILVLSLWLEKVGPRISHSPLKVGPWVRESAFLGWCFQRGAFLPSYVAILPLHIGFLYFIVMWILGSFMKDLRTELHIRASLNSNVSSIILFFKHTSMLFEWLLSPLRGWLKDIRKLTVVPPQLP